MAADFEKKKVFEKCPKKKNIAFILTPEKASGA